MLTSRRGTLVTFVAIGNDAKSVPGKSGSGLVSADNFYCPNAIALSAFRIGMLKSGVLALLKGGA